MAYYKLIKKDTSVAGTYKLTETLNAWSKPYIYEGSKAKKVSKNTIFEVDYMLTVQYTTVIPAYKKTTKRKWLHCTKLGKKSYNGYIPYNGVALARDEEGEKGTTYPYSVKISQNYAGKEHTDSSVTASKKVKKKIKNEDRSEAVKAALKALGGEENESSIENFKSRYMITYGNKLKHLGAFNRYQYQNQFNVINGTREYIFFTKPKLGILKGNGKGVLVDPLKDDPFWKEMLAYYKRVIGYLQGDKVGNLNSRQSKNTNYKLEFIPLLTNMVAGSLDMPSKSAETTDTAANIYGTSIQYRKGSYKSDEGYDFSLEFYDDRWLDVYHLFRIWDEYESLKDIGILGPPGKKSMNGWRYYKRLHDQISIYKFIVDADDMSTILYYAKFTGCFPKSVPREAFSEIKDGIITYSVEWHAQFVEDMNPAILYEFNDLCDKSISGMTPPNGSNWNNYAANFNHSQGNMRFADSGFVTCPYIVRTDEVTSDSPTGVSYRLIWLDADNGKTKSYKKSPSTSTAFDQ